MTDYLGLDDSMVIRRFYGFTAMQLLKYFNDHVEYAGAKKVDIREWMKTEADYIKKNDK